MRQEIIHDALDFLDEEMIEKVAFLRDRKRLIRIKLLRWGALAACFCVAFLGVGMWSMSVGDSTGDSCVANDGAAVSDQDYNGVGSETGKGQGVTLPRMEISLDADEEGDMIAFFIYQGRSYVQYELIEEDVDFVGEYLGTATGMIDEWTPKKGYVELAGSIKGDFYEVKGFEPSFMLCMKHQDGTTETYINDNGYSLEKGSELFEDRLHLTGNYHTVEYQTRQDWFYDMGDPIAIPQTCQNVIERFVEAVDQASFMYAEDVPLKEGESNIYDKEIYHLFFRMNNGMTVHMRLYEGGYVRFQGLIPVCVKVEGAVFDELVDILAEEQSK